jgi:hypothetical protein
MLPNGAFLAGWPRRMPPIWLNAALEKNPKY